MTRAIAVIPTNLERTPLGLPSLLARRIAGRSVLAHTVARVARIKSIHTIVLVHPAGQDPLPLLEGFKSSRKVTALAAPADAPDPYRTMRAAARRWVPHAWRGGLGGATCYDELLPAAPLLQAMSEARAQSALLLGADWMLVDPDYCQKVLELHLKHPEGMQVTFNQAPPGLSGIVIGEKVMGQLNENPGGTLGQIFAYVPTRPQPDPIGRDVCVQIDGAVRSCARRFIYDSPRTATMIDALAARLGDALNDTPAAGVAAALSEIESGNGGGSGGFGEAGGWAPLPLQVTLELTPQRKVTGPVAPQHYVKFERAAIDTDLALSIVQQLGGGQDTVLMLGGLGDALLHPHWDRIVSAAHASGVGGIGIETDLLCDTATLSRMLELPLDVISVRVNADRAAAYQETMGVDAFGQVIHNLQRLHDERAQRWQHGRAVGLALLAMGVPWIVPRILKSAQTLPEMENFYDKWLHLLGHAVIEPATSGCGLMPELSPLDMSPPRRRACRQLSGRMTILSTGQVARCDQDWLGRAIAGDAAVTPLKEIWSSMQPLRSAHAAGQWKDLQLCGGCKEWHRP